MNNKPIIGVLLGDGAGVGGELVAKLATNGFLEEHCKPIIIGDARVFNRAMELIGKTTKVQCIDSAEQATWQDGIPLLDRKNLDPNSFEVGKLSELCGKAEIDMLELGVELYKEGKIDGFCFAPLNKAAMISAGCPFESEHHLMANLFAHTAPFGEINVLGDMWTTRTTSHIPIKDVSKNLTVERIMRAITLANTTLKNAGFEQPRLGIAALNPHAGEGGLCGREELEVIEPAIKEATAQGMSVFGPFPSDILFIKAFKGEFDGVVTMYHDQGQIALKLKGFEQGITIAGGLPAPIVTCAHGTAYDIAGKGIAGTSSFENAIKMACRMAGHIKVKQ